MAVRVSRRRPDGSIQVRWITLISRVIEKSSAFAVCLLDRVCEIIGFTPNDTMKLVGDCAPYWRSYNFLGSQISIVQRKYKISIENVFLMDEHGKGCIDGLCWG